MAEIVNLRRARKRKERQNAEAAAADRRRTFGQPKAQRKLSEAAETLQRRRHEGHRLDDEPAEDG